MINTVLKVDLEGDRGSSFSQDEIKSDGLGSKFYKGDWHDLTRVLSIITKSKLHNPEGIGIPKHIAYYKLI